MRLYLCEKPSQGKDIARVLGAKARSEGCYSGAGLAVTWCIGHLFETAPPESYGERRSGRCRLFPERDASKSKQRRRRSSKSSNTCWRRRLI